MSKVIRLTKPKSKRRKSPQMPLAFPLLNEQPYSRVKYWPSNRHREVVRVGAEPWAVAWDEAHEWGRLCECGRGHKWENCEYVS